MHSVHSDDEEQSLLSLAAQGDHMAFGTLYERYLHEIYRYVYYRIGDPTEAEDITANTFLKTWKHLPKIQQQNAGFRNFRSWLYRVARNLVIDYYKKKETPPFPDGIYEDQDSTHESAEQNIQTDLLVKAIMRLRPDYQQIIILRFINQLSHQETANIMGISTGQTRTMQYRALKELREIISDEAI